MAKAKREEKGEEGGDYEFKLPPFDERAFMRREVQAARASFWTLGLGVLAGLVAYAVFLTPLDWKYGWVPVFGSLLFLGPMLKRAGFNEDVTKPKALIGSYFMVFFTALAVWILGTNVYQG